MVIIESKSSPDQSRQIKRLAIGRTFGEGQGKRVGLVSRNDVDHSKRFPELFAAVAALPGRALVLDGEVAIYAEQLRSRVEWRREPDPDAIASPPLFMVFDLLYHDHGTTTNDERSSDRTVVVSQSSRSASISDR